MWAITRRIWLSLWFSRPARVMLVFIGLSLNGAGAMLVLLFLAATFTIFALVCMVIYPKPWLASRLRRLSRVNTWLGNRSEGSPFCLVLRTFGRDGDAIFSRTGPVSWWAVPASVLGVLTMTAEQVIAVACRGQSLVSRSIADPRALFTPPNVRYEYAEDARWQQAAMKLINDADVIAILIQPTGACRAQRILAEADDLLRDDQAGWRVSVGQRLRYRIYRLVTPLRGDDKLGALLSPGLAWEIQQIRKASRVHRTIVVLPPNHPRSPSHAVARRQAAIIAALLTDRNFDQDQFAMMERRDIPPGTIVVEAGSGGPAYRWFSATALREKERYGTETYRSAIADAISRIRAKNLR